MQPISLVEIWRGPFLESQHMGHAVVCNAKGDTLAAFGAPETVVLPRSSAKMIQALPLVESGAAQAVDLKPAHLALACASHQGAEIHVSHVSQWLKDLELSETNLRCGVQPSRDADYHAQMLRTGAPACQIHNNCSGKHAGFLTLSRHLGGGTEYNDPAHPVQCAVKDAWERVTEEDVSGHAIDGCSAPNFATSLRGIAHAMAKFATADSDSPEGQLVAAMMAHPELVAGEGRACTALMRAAPGKLAVKTGAEGVFVAMLPEQGLGIALKITDGATRAAECAITALLVRYGVLEPASPAALAYLNAPIKNWRGLTTGYQRAAPALC